MKFCQLGKISSHLEFLKAYLALGKILKKLEFSELLEFLRHLFKQYLVHQMLIEDKGSGISLIQNLKRDFASKISAIKANLPKEVRFLSSISFLS